MYRLRGKSTSTAHHSVSLEKRQDAPWRGAAGWCGWAEEVNMVLLACKRMLKVMKEERKIVPV